MLETQSTKESVTGARRAVRRHHAARRKARVAREFYWQIAFQRGRRRAPKLCSCFMCGNPRRYFGEPTLRELRARAAAGTWQPLSERRCCRP